MLSDGNVDVIAVRNKVEAKYPSTAEYDQAFFTDEISLVILLETFLYPPC